MDPKKPVNKRKGANLPHWTQEGATYAVTFRMADSLPAAAVEKLANERRQLERELAMTGSLSKPEDFERLDQLCAERVEAWLDQCHGSCALRDPEIAEVVANALKHFDGIRYELPAWCVMPNHVHTVLKPLADWTLPDIVYSWKSYSARMINRRLKRSGEFWQSEYYDHLVRSEFDLNRCIRYVALNPAKAGLADWRWVHPVLDVRISGNEAT